MILTLFITAIVLLLALVGFTYSKVEHKSYQISLGVILVGGLLIYSYIYHQTEINSLLVPLQAAWAVVKMFTGGQEYSRALQTEFFQNPWAQLVFWLIHAFALYITASATVKLLGQSLIRRFQVWLNRKKTLSLIFGLNKDSLEFAKKLEKSGTVIYLDTETSDSADRLKSDKSKNVFVGDIDNKVLQRFGINGSREHISAYALSTDYEANLQFAETLSELAEKISLTLMGDEEDYLEDEKFNNFKNIYVTNPLTLSARQLIKESAPYQVMQFKGGVAMNDFHLLQIGFGHIGQEVLKQIYMNAQFVGSQFKADIFSPDAETNTGRIKAMTAFMDDEGITLHPYKCESPDFYQFAEENRDSVNYIVVATGDSERNREFARHLRRQFPAARIHIVQTDGVYTKGDFYPNFTRDLLDSASLDEKAKLLNYEYYKWDKNYKINKSNPEDIWRSTKKRAGTDYFSRMSSRASADFSPVIREVSQIPLSEKWVDEVKKTGLYEILGQMEHIRWNAFHKVMNYSPMSETTIRERAKVTATNLDLLKQIAEKEDKSLQKVFIGEITKDRTTRQHACLIDWDKLPWLDDLVEELCRECLGGLSDSSKSYQDMDKEFVKMVPKLHGIREK